MEKPLKCVKKLNSYPLQKLVITTQPLKNKRQHPDKVEIKKFDPRIRKYVLYKEAKIK